MDIELTFLSKAIQTESVQRMIVKGVASDHFTDEVNKEVWIYCNDYIQRYKSHPSVEAVTRDIPEFRFQVSTDSVDYLFDEFAKLTKRRTALQGLVKIGEIVDDSEDISRVGEELISLGQGVETLFKQGNPARYSEMLSRIKEYEKHEETGDPFGILTGIPEIDNITFGIQPHELVTVAGFSGMGKSTLALQIAYSAYQQGYTPLVISLEMESGAIYRKFDTLATHINTRSMKSLELTDEDKELWREEAEKAIENENDIIVLDNIGDCTLEKVYSLSKQYKPDLLIIDYITLMKLPGERLNTYEKIKSLTHELKAMARDPECPPIISVAQSNRSAAEKGSTIDNIGDSISIVQDSDIVIGLHQTEEMKINKQMEVRLLKNRDGETATSIMFWNPARMEFRAWNVATDEFAVKLPDTRNLGFSSEVADSKAIFHVEDDMGLMDQEPLFEEGPYGVFQEAVTTYVNAEKSSPLNENWRED